MSLKIDPDLPTPTCVPYQPSLLSLSPVPPTLLPPPSLSAVRASVPAQRRSDLGVSRPRQEGSSGPRHGSVTAPMAPVMGGPARQGQHKWLPGGSGFPLPVVRVLSHCRILLAALGSRRRAVASGELHMPTSLHSLKQQADVTLR
jgi:hypothetical protein